MTASPDEPDENPEIEMVDSEPQPADEGSPFESADDVDCLVIEHKTLCRVKRVNPAHVHEPGVYMAEKLYQLLKRYQLAGLRVPLEVHRTADVRRTLVL